MLLFRKFSECTKWMIPKVNLDVQFLSAFTWLKLTTETLEQGVKYVQS